MTTLILEFAPDAQPFTNSINARENTNKNFNIAQTLFKLFTPFPFEQCSSRKYNRNPGGSGLSLSTRFNKQHDNGKDFGD